MPRRKIYYASVLNSYRNEYLLCAPCSVLILFFSLLLLLILLLLLFSRHHFSHKFSYYGLYDVATSVDQQRHHHCTPLYRFICVIGIEVTENENENEKEQSENKKNRTHFTVLQILIIGKSKH